MLVILGTSRPDGQYHKALEAIGRSVADIIDLNRHSIAPYHYGDDYPPQDEFLTIAGRMASANSILFATPVYWYAMSAQMKILFDHFTDLVTVRKNLGRQLAGKRVYLLAWGHEAELPEGFEVPFARTSDYLDMDYKGCFYYCTGADADIEQRGREAESFRARLLD